MTHLQRVDQIKFLGLWFDSELTFKQHIDHVLHEMLHFILCLVSVVNTSTISFSQCVQNRPPTSKFRTQ